MPITGTRQPNAGEDSQALVSAGELGSPSVSLDGPVFVKLRQWGCRHRVSPAPPLQLNHPLAGGLPKLVALSSLTKGSADTPGSEMGENTGLV